jgi:multidrug transporter EmrE-like cation transporter
MHLYRASRQAAIPLTYCFMSGTWLVFCIVGFMIASALSSVQFKLAAETSGRTALWHFILGNMIGALGPVALTFALKRANPNIVYALCFGGAFTLLQVVSWRLFHQPLSAFQWAGIGCVAIGIVLLQMRGA